MISSQKPADFKPRFEIASCYVMHGDAFLLLHRLPNKSQGSKWGVPAGKLEQNENPAEAMARELLEETGLKAERSDLEFFNTVYVRYPDYDFTYHMFSMALNERPGIATKEDEHQAYRWVTPRESLSLNLVDDLDGCIKLFYNI